MGRNALHNAGDTILDSVRNAATLRHEIAVHDGRTGKLVTLVPKHPPDMALSRPALSSILEKVLLERHQVEVRRGAKVVELGGSYKHHKWR